MLRFTVELAKLFDITPFEIFNQEKNQVLMMIDYFLSKDDAKTEQDATPRQIENAGGYADPMWNYI